MTNKNIKLDKEDMDNLVAVFSLLFKWDKEQNPENYRNLPESIDSEDKSSCDGK